MDWSELLTFLKTIRLESNDLLQVTDFSKSH